MALMLISCATHSEEIDWDKDKPNNDDPVNNGNQDNNIDDIFDNSDVEPPQIPTE